MLVLTMAYATLGVTPIIRGALYGLGPVVLGIFLVAVYRLGRSAVNTISQAMIAIAAASALLFSPLGMAPILLLAGGMGLLLFHSKKVGTVVLVLSTALLGILQFPLWSTSAPVLLMPQGASPAAGLTDIGVFFFKAGAFTFGGGLTMIAFIQDQVVNQLHWLTPQEFIDGLALGQFTPGPILMVAAYVGYKVMGIAGAVVGAAAVFFPSFILMLAILPVLHRVRALVWTKAAMQGIGPAVIGVLAVSLVQMVPHALPDPLALAMLLATVIALLMWRIGTVKMMLAGSVFGVLRSRLLSLPGVKAAFSLGLWVGI
jgi:chromate transporter